jgi:hypothetical protein
VLVQEFQEPEHDTRTSNGWHFCPSGLCFFGCCYGCIHVTSVTQNHLFGDGTGGWVVNGLNARGIGTGGLAIDEVFNQRQVLRAGHLRNSC